MASSRLFDLQMCAIKSPDRGTRQTYLFSGATGFDLCSALRPFTLVGIAGEDDLDLSYIARE